MVQYALGAKATTLGEAIVQAKAEVSNGDVRRTFVLFGDPAMYVKQPGPGSSH